MDPLYKTFRELIRRNKWVVEKDRILVALSGGLDSMVLAHLLVRLRQEVDFTMMTAHVNYQMRGEESQRQADWVRTFAAKSEIQSFVRTLEPAIFTEGTHGNFQEEARKIRYQFFGDLGQELNLHKVFLGHHFEDQVETILGHLLRGSSLQGIAGMRTESCVSFSGWPLQLIRPLLSFSKQELGAYAGRNDLLYIEDSSNQDAKYLRNRIRAELLPMMDSLRPRSFEKITTFAQECRELSDYLKGEAKKWLDQFSRTEGGSVFFPRPPFLLLPKVQRYEILYEGVALLGGCQNLQRDHLFRCNQICEGSSLGGSYLLPNNLIFLREKDRLLLKQKSYATEKNNESTK